MTVIVEYDMNAPYPFGSGGTITVREGLGRDFRNLAKQPSYYTPDGPCDEMVYFFAPFVYAGILTCDDGYEREEGGYTNLYTLAVPLHEALASLNAAVLETA